MNLLARLSSTPGFREKLEANRSKLYRMAFAWCGDAMLADDLAQDAITKALQNSHQLRDANKFSSWQCAILYNCWREHLRRSKPTTELDDSKMVNDHTPEKDQDEQEIIARVRTAIAGLPTGQRETITLVDLDDLSYAEVASILDIPIGTVMSRLSRARKALQAELIDMQTGLRTARNLRSVK